MTREEAINKVRQMSLPKETMDILEALAPELTMSEDERIRKELLEVIRHCYEDGGYALCTDDYKKYSAYLEKQKESQELPLMNGDADLYFDTWRQEVPVPTFRQCFEEGMRYTQRLQKEQKPAEWSEEDVYIATILEHIVGKNRPNEIFKIGNKQGISAYKICSWLKYLPKRLNLQPKEEWSDEDEQRIAEIEFAVMQMNTKRVDTKDKCLAWLKSLRPQSKQEWSEEDERILKGIIGLIDHDQHYGVSNNEMISWLKTLRPQLKQKWSEEDKKMLWIIQLALTKHPITDKQEKDAFDWLNSLRPNQKSEWSKEDEDTYNLVYWLFKDAIDEWYETIFTGCYPKITRDKVLAMLKSLHPQPQTKTNDYITPHKKFFQWIYNRLVDVHGENPNVDYMQSFKKRIDNLQFDEPQWKPSEEQMDALRASNSYWRGASNETPCINLLESLHDDLEKLIAKR